MEAEFTNKRNSSRKKLFTTLCTWLLLLEAFYAYRYYGAPYNYQTGELFSKFWLTKNMYWFLSVFTAVFFLAAALYSKIITRLNFSTTNNTLTVDYIDRFGIIKKTKTVTLSDTQIQIDHQEQTDYWLMRNTPEYFIIYIQNPELGKIRVSDQDFDNIKEIAKYVDDLKMEYAQIARKKRLLRRR